MASHAVPVLLQWPVFLLYSKIVDEDWVQYMRQVMVDGRTNFYEHSQMARKAAAAGSPSERLRQL
jgi:hypothetical protein